MGDTILGSGPLANRGKEIRSNDLTSVGNRTLRWKLIPSPSQWVSASATSRFSFMDRRRSPEIRKVDACVEEFNRISTLPKPQTADLWQAAVDLMEAIEVYLACPRGHKQPRIDAMYDLREATKATLTILRWRKVKDVAWAKPGMKPIVESVWSEVHSPGARARGARR